MKEFYADPGVRRVAEFHDAFTCHHAKEPWLPELSVADKRLLQDTAAGLAKIARRLKRQAAEANGLGRAGLGLLLVRIQLLVEETGEVAEAMAEGDMAHLLQELSDVCYVADGTFLTCGLGHVKDPASRELHSANMSKLWPDGTPHLNEAGRVMKGPNTRKPDMKKVLDDHYPRD